MSEGYASETPKASEQSLFISEQEQLNQELELLHKHLHHLRHKIAPFRNDNVEATQRTDPPTLHSIDDSRIVLSPSGRMLRESIYKARKLQEFVRELTDEVVA